MKIRVKALELDSLLNEQIGLIPRLFNTLKAGGKLIDDLGPLASELQGVRRALSAMKLPRGLRGNSADDIIQSIFEATPELQGQMDSVIGTVITRLRNGEAVEIGDKAVEGAVRLRFKGKIKYIDPDTGLVTRTQRPVTIHLTVTKDGVVENSVGIGKTGSSRSLKAWRANGGVSSATRRGAGVDDATPSGRPRDADRLSPNVLDDPALDPEDLNWIEDNKIADPKALQFFVDRLGELKDRSRRFAPDDYEKSLASLHEIVIKINKGDAVVLGEDAIKDLFAKTVKERLQFAEDAGAIEVDKAIDIPLVDSLGRVVINEKGLVANVRLAAGDTPSYRGRGKQLFYGQAGEGSFDLIKIKDELRAAVDLTAKMDVNNNTFRQAWKRLLEDPRMESGNFIEQLEAFREAMAEAIQGTLKILNQETRQWYFPVKGAGMKDIKDVGGLRWTFVGLDLLAGNGFTRALAAVGTTFLRTFLGMSRAGGLVSTVGLSRAFATIQALYIIGYVGILYHWFASKSLREERRLYGLAVNDRKEPRKARLAYLYTYEPLFKENGWIMPKFSENMTDGQLLAVVMKTHNAFLENAENSGWGWSTLAKTKGVLDGMTGPLPDNAIDLTTAMFPDIDKITSLDKSSQDAMNRDADSASSELKNLENVADKSLEVIKKMSVNTKEANKKAEKAVSGQRTPSTEPDLGLPTSPRGRKKAPQSDDDVSIGDLKGLEDALYEIFSEDKSIGIKVKSSPLRLRAKITEKK